MSCHNCNPCPACGEDDADRREEREEATKELRDALRDLLGMYDEGPGGPEWSGCFCPSGPWGPHPDDCHVKRIARIRKLLGG